MKRESGDSDYSGINLVVSAVLGAVLFALLGASFFPWASEIWWRAYGAFVVMGAIIGAVGNALYGDEIWEWISRLFPWGR